MKIYIAANTSGLKAAFTCEPERLEVLKEVHWVLPNGNGRRVNDLSPFIQHFDIEPGTFQVWHLKGPKPCPAP